VKGKPIQPDVILNKEAQSPVPVQQCRHNDVSECAVGGRYRTRGNQYSLLDSHVHHSTAIRLSGDSGKHWKMQFIIQRSRSVDCRGRHGVSSLQSQTMHCATRLYLRQAASKFYGTATLRMKIHRNSSINERLERTSGPAITNIGMCPYWILLLEV